MNNAAQFMPTIAYMSSTKTTLHGLFYYFVLSQAETEWSGVLPGGLLRVGSIGCGAYWMWPVTPTLADSAFPAEATEGIAGLSSNGDWVCCRHLHVAPFHRLLKRLRQPKSAKVFPAF